MFILAALKKNFLSVLLKGRSLQKLRNNRLVVVSKSRSECTCFGKRQKGKSKSHPSKMVQFRIRIITVTALFNFYTWFSDIWNEIWNCAWKLGYNSVSPFFKNYFYTMFRAH